MGGEGIHRKNKIKKRIGKGEMRGRVSEDEACERIRKLNVKHQIHKVRTCIRVKTD